MVKTAVSFCLFLVVIFVSPITKAQIVEKHFFSDTLGGGFNYIHDHIQQEDGIILSGYKGKGGVNVPVILKIDRAGEVIWSTETAYIPDSSNYDEFNIQLFSDGYIYGVSRANNYPNFDRNLWKVNAQSGNVEYVIPYLNATGSVLTSPIWKDYDSASFYMMQGSTIRRVSKVNGSTMDEIVFINVSALVSFEMEIDKNGNFYVLRYDRLTKYNGNDFNEVLWSRTYTEFNLNELQRIHIDEYGDVFVFGKDGVSGVGVIMKINKQSGVKTWLCKVQNTTDIDMTENNVNMVDFKDASGKIYATFQHAYVGGSDKKIVSARINKSTGGLEWLSQTGIDNTGFTSSYQGRSALSLDVDCDGNVYQTGYYDSDNYGPGKWGSMKLNSSNGAKLYEFTVSKDTSANEAFSSGLGAFAYGDSPIFIGHEQIQNGNANVRPLFVKITPNNGNIVVKKPVGKLENGIVSTLKIISDNGVIYFLKQNGRAVTVEARDIQYELLWDYSVLNDSLLTYGGSIIQSGNSLVFSVVQYPLIGGSNVIISKLDCSSGALLFENSLHSYHSNLLPFELESDNQEVYVFSKTTDSLWYSKVNNSQFDQWLLLENTNVFNNYDGELNIVLNKDVLTLQVIGTSGLFEISKGTMQKSFVGPHAQPAIYYSFSKLNDLIIMCGKSQNNQQILTAINLPNWTTLWSENYASNGTIAKTTFGAINDLYFAGTENGNLNVQHVSLVNGAADWSYSTDSTLFPDSDALDILYNSTDDYIAVAGFNSSGTTSHAIIQLLSSVGDSFYSWHGVDDLMGRSRTNTLANISGSLIGAGGAWSQFIRTNEGFVFYLDSTNQDINLGLNQNNSNLCIYPNPATNKLFIKGLENRYSYLIMDLTGKLVQFQNGRSEYEINLDNLNSGAYQLRIEYNGEIILFSLIII